MATTRFATAYARISGILLVLAGLWGVLGLATGSIGFLRTDVLLWDTPHNVLLLVLGIVGLAVGFAPRPPIGHMTYGKVFGVVYALLGLATFADPALLLGLGMRFELLESLLYLLLGLLGLVAGFLAVEDVEPAPRPTPWPAPEPLPGFAYPPPTVRHQPIEAVEGVGEVYGTKLRAVGIQELEDLLARDPDQVAAQAGLEPHHVLEWHQMVQLQAVSGVGKQYSELLVRCGVPGLAALSEEKPGALAKRLRAFEEGREVRITGGHVTTAMAKDWVRQAKAYVKQGLPSVGRRSSRAATGG